MCKPKGAAIPQPKPIPIQEATQANAANSKASVQEKGKADTLAGRESKTGARGLSDEAQTKKKNLLGE